MFFCVYVTLLGLIHNGSKRVGTAESIGTVGTGTGELPLHELGFNPPLVQ